MKKTPGPDVLTGEFYQTLRKEFMPTLIKHFHKIKADGTPPNSFYETNITLIPKPNKDTTRKQYHDIDIPDEHRYKDSQQDTSKKKSTEHGKDLYYNQVGFNPGMQTQTNKCDMPH